MSAPTSSAYIGKFIESKKIKSIDLIPNTSRLLVTFEDDTTIEITILLLDEAITDQPIDASAYRDRVSQAIALRVMKLFLDWDIEVGYAQYITSLVITSLTEFEKEADVMKWGKQKHKILMSELDKVLKGN